MKQNRTILHLIVLCSLLLPLPLKSQDKFYIHPGASPGGDGTIDFPFDSIRNITWEANSTYYFKRGTTTGENIAIETNNIILDAYGEGDRPKIKIKGGKGVTAVQIRADNCQIRNLDISTTKNSIGAALEVSRCKNGEVYNCVIAGADVGLSTYLIEGTFKLLNSVVHSIGQDGVYFSNTDTVIVDSCHVYDVNMSFNIGIYGKGNGDGIQTNSIDYTKITNTIVDRTGTNNKFCIILQASKNIEMENCILYGSDLVYDEFYIENDIGMHCLYLSGVSGYSKIKNCKFYSSVYGLWNQYSSNIEVDSCEFYNQMSHCVRGATNNMTLTNCLFYNPGYTALEAGWSAPVALHFYNNTFFKGSSIAGSGDAMEGRDNLYYPIWHKIGLYDGNPIDGYLGKDYDRIFAPSTHRYSVINKKLKAQSYLYVDSPDIYECYYLTREDNEVAKLLYDVNNKSFIVFPINNATLNLSMHNSRDSLLFSESNFSETTIVNTREWADSICRISLNSTNNTSGFNESVFRVDSMYYTAYQMPQSKVTLPLNFLVYYTPQNKALNVKVKNYDETPFIIKVYDLQGLLIKTFRLETENSELIVDFLERGIYIVDIMYDLGLKHEGAKFVVY